MKLRVLVILAALVLLVVVAGWFLAGKNSTSTTGIQMEIGPVSAPPLPVPPQVGLAPNSAPPAPVAVVQSSPPAAAPAQVQPGTSGPSGPMVQPMQLPVQQPRPAGSPPIVGATSTPQPPPQAGSNKPLAVTEDAVTATSIDLDQASLMLRDFRTLAGENPVGTNAEIMKAVMGDNPKGAKLGPPEGQKLNANGELVDRWGTPYFFHQMSATSMEIHSAGPDKTFGTSDDIIHR